MTRRDPCLLQLKHGALLVLTIIFAATAAPVYENEQTAIESYDGAENGCYYNYNHYGEGDRIVTNEPCLNCTCHNKMLMCYLRVCPFTKPIGQDCVIEKREDQCCPVITCPQVPVELEDSTTISSTDLALPDNYGCSINGHFYAEGAQVPSNPNKPCELCYCIRNMTACVMQECTLHIDGCQPIYNRGVCCPVRYSCDHDSDSPPMLEDHSDFTTIRPTEGFMLATPKSETSECSYDNQTYSDGVEIKTSNPCQHCYCMKGDIVCAVPECGLPLENEEKDCVAVPPKEGQCCPDTYICDGSETVTIPPESDSQTQDEDLQQHIVPQKIPTKGGAPVDTKRKGPVTKRPIEEIPKDTKADKSSEEDDTTVAATKAPATHDEATKPIDDSAEDESGEDMDTTKAPGEKHTEAPSSGEEHTTEHILGHAPDLDERVSEDGTDDESDTTLKPDDQQAEEQTTVKSGMKPEDDEHKPSEEETEAPAPGQATTLKSVVPETDEEEYSGDDEPHTEKPRLTTQAPASDEKTEAPETTEHVKAEDHTDKPAESEETTKAESDEVLGKGEGPKGSAESGESTEDKLPTTPAPSSEEVESDTTKSPSRVDEPVTEHDEAVTEHEEPTTKHQEPITLKPVDEDVEQSATEHEEPATVPPAVKGQEIPEEEEPSAVPTEAPATDKPADHDDDESSGDETTEVSVKDAATELPVRTDVDEEPKTESPAEDKLTTLKSTEPESHTEDSVIEGTTKVSDSEEGMGKGEGPKGSAESGESTEDKLPSTTVSSHDEDETKRPYEEPATVAPVDEAVTTHEESVTEHEEPATHKPSDEDLEKPAEHDELTTVSPSVKGQEVPEDEETPVASTDAQQEDEVTTPHAKPEEDEVTTPHAQPEDEITTPHEKHDLPSRTDGSEEDKQETTPEADEMPATKKPESDYAELPPKEIVTELPPAPSDEDLPSPVTMKQEPIESDSHMMGETTPEVSADEVTTTSRPDVRDEEESDDMNTIMPERATERPDKTYIPPTTVQYDGEETTERQTESPYDEQPPRIPGETDCLFNGISYRNGDPIKTDEECLESCFCHNSVVRCKSSCEYEPTVTERTGDEDEETSTAKVVEVTKPSVEVPAVVKEIFPTEAPITDDEKTEENEIDTDEETTSRPVVKTPLEPESGESTDKPTEDEKDTLTEAPVTDKHAPEISTEENLVDSDEDKDETTTFAAPHDKHEPTAEDKTEIPVPEMPDDVIITSKPLIPDSHMRPVEDEDETTTHVPKDKPSSVDDRISSDEDEGQVTVRTDLTTESEVQATEKPEDIAPVTIKIDMPATDTPVKSEPSTEEPEEAVTNKDEVHTEAPVTMKADSSTEAPESGEEPQVTVKADSSTEAPESGEEPQVTMKADSSTEAPESGEAPSETEAPKEAPATEQPKEAPATEQPKEAPATEEPSEAPATEAPKEAPVTEIEERDTEAPATVKADVSTEAPESGEEPSETEAPKEAPTTEAHEEVPATEAPKEAPATEKPEEEEPKEAPATEAPSTEPQDKVTEQPMESHEDTTSKREEPVDLDETSEVSATTLKPKDSQEEDEDVVTLRAPIDEKPVTTKTDLRPESEEDLTEKPAVTERVDVDRPEEPSSEESTTVHDAEDHTEKAEPEAPATTPREVDEHDEQATLKPEPHVPELETDHVTEAVTDKAAPEDDSETEKPAEVTEKTDHDVPTEPSVVPKEEDSQEKEETTHKQDEVPEHPTQAPVEPSSGETTQRVTEPPTEESEDTTLGAPHSVDSKFSPEETTDSVEEAKTTKPEEATSSPDVSEEIETTRKPEVEATTPVVKDEVEPSKPEDDSEKPEAGTELPEVTTTPEVIKEAPTSKPDSEEEQPAEPESTPHPVVDEKEVDQTTTVKAEEEPVKPDEEQPAKPESETDKPTETTPSKPDSEEEQPAEPESTPQTVLGERVDVDQTTTIKPEDEKTHKPTESEEDTQKPIDHDQDIQKPVDHDVQVPQHPHEEPFTTDRPVKQPGQDTFPPSGYPSYDDDYTEEDEDPAQFGPGTCRYGGKLYVSAQQIPRDDPCDFCFCFRSDIICLQQSCPPPIQGCHEEPIPGFCCPRYECHVKMATVMNITTSTTTTTTTLPPHFVNSYKGAARKSGCQIQGKAYAVGEEVVASSGPCMRCICGGDANMKCEPKACSPAPMLQQMIAVAAQRRRR